MAKLKGDNQDALLLAIEQVNSDLKEEENQAEKEQIIVQEDPASLSLPTEQASESTAQQTRDESQENNEETQLTSASFIMPVETEAEIEEQVEEVVVDKKKTKAQKNVHAAKILKQHL